MNQTKKATITQSYTTTISRILLATLLLTHTITAFHNTWDGRCLDNNSFDWTKFVKNMDDPAYEVNTKLYYSLVNRAIEIPSVLLIKIDTSQSTYNDKIDFCPRSEPMPIKQNRFASSDARDVCFTVKVGPSQIESAFVDMYDEENMDQINQYREQNLKELVQEMKEYNFGNCLREINQYLFASYTQFIYTSAHYKFSNIDQVGVNHYEKWDIVTPENVYMVREKLPGTIMDVINNKFEFMTADDSTPQSKQKTEATKPFHDVIIFQMARALNIIHKLGFTHRDIKPDNFYIKKTVDRKIEVYLGEFHNSLMTTYVKPGSEEDHVSGSPLYIPANASEHIGEQTNDLYQFGLTVEQLLSHVQVEEVFLEAHEGLEIHDIANNSVKVQDKIEEELKLIVAEHEETRNSTTKPKNTTPKNNVSLTNLSFNVEQLDFSYLDMEMKVDKQSNDRLRRRRRRRILEANNQNRRLEIGQRELTGKQSNIASNEELLESYMTGDTFGITNTDNLAELNYNPLANLETAEVIKKAEDEISKNDVLDNLNITTHSLPSGNVQTITNEQAIEVDKLMNQELTQNSVFKKEERPMQINELQDPIEFKNKDKTLLFYIAM